MTKIKQHIQSTCTAALLLASLSACVVNDPFTKQETGGIDFKRDAYARADAVRSWRSCRDNAFALDSQARKGGDTAKYLASSKLLVQCESEIGPEAASAAKDERFKAYALAVLNYLKAGDIKASREVLNKLQKGFPGQDLYLPGHVSFIETMDVLTGGQSRQSIKAFPMRNLSKELKKELRRIRYWKNH